MFFIVGRGRSGTDLLSRMLNTHPDICIPPESSLITFLANKYDKKDFSKERVRKNFCKDVFKEQKIHYWWKLNQKELFDYLNQQQFSNYAEAITHVFRHYAEKNHKAQAKYFGDKDPAHTLYLNTLKSIYPDAKFIALVRHPVDNVNSFLKVEFDSSNVNTLASRWVLYNQAMIDFKKQHEHEVFLLQYEELVEKPESVLSEIAKFLSVDNAFSLELNDAKIKIRGKWQENLADPISAKQVGKGLRELDGNKQKRIMAYCAGLAKNLGYKIEPEPEPEPDQHLKPGFFSNMATLFEKVLFKMPLVLSAKVLRLYRIKTGAFKDQAL